MPENPDLMNAAISCVSLRGEMSVFPRIRVCFAGMSACLTGLGGNPGSFHARKRAGRSRSQQVSSRHPVPGGTIPHTKTSPIWPRIPLFRIPPLPEKPRKALRLCSHGNGHEIRPLLPKYARFRCQIMGHHGPATGMIFATSNHLRDHEIGRRNAAKCAGPDL